MTRWIVGFAIAFRITLLFSEPIQEVDIYRYLRDGIVSTQGVSPFAYAPQTVAESLPSDELPENPWYWIGALPWVAYARNRMWLVLSGLLFIYYLRFYFESQTGLRIGAYTGVLIFDYVVVWLEYVPWFAALIGWKVWTARSSVKRVLQNLVSARTFGVEML